MILNEEHVDLTTAEKCIEAVKNNSTGNKILPEWKSANAEVINSIIGKIGNPNTTTPIMSIVFSKIKPADCSKVDFAKLGSYYAKDNFKKSAEFQEFLKTGNIEKLNAAIAIIDKAPKKAKKSEVKQLYPTGSKYDKDGWQLVIPLSFEGEKAAAFYGKEGEEQTATNWCTRADIKFYNLYTKNNTHPLYIIRNYKTGKAYQIGFTVHIEYYYYDPEDEDDDKIEVHFLDQNDKVGDRLTAGDISSLPDELCKQIRIWRKDGKTLLDFKNAPNEYVDPRKKTKKKSYDPETGKELEDADDYYGNNKTVTRGEIGRTTWSKPIAVQKEVIKRALNIIKELSISHTVDDIEKKCENGISYIYSKGAVEVPLRSSSFENFYNDNRKEVTTKYPKICIKRYYFNDTPKAFFSVCYNSITGRDSRVLMSHPEENDYLAYLRDFFGAIDDCMDYKKSDLKKSQAKKEEFSKENYYGKVWSMYIATKNKYKKELKECGIKDIYLGFIPFLGDGPADVSLRFFSEEPHICPNSIFDIAVVLDDDDDSYVLLQFQKNNINSLMYNDCDLSKHSLNLLIKIRNEYLKRYIKKFRNVIQRRRMRGYIYEEKDFDY